jgi:transcriptional regulator with PAS, ATPase and Fis domain
MRMILQIHDPSGNIRHLEFREDSLWVGNDPQMDIPLRDPLAGALSFQLQRNGEKSFWLKAHEEAPEIRLGDIRVRQAEIPVGQSLRIGETVLKIIPHESDLHLPVQPSGIPHWLTQAQSGRDTLWMARKAASTGLAIYLAGETGVGKEVLARLVHAWSERASGPFIPIHCGALPISLAESELFGHTKGAFTGAHRQRPGAFSQAHGGTLFLDEIGDLSLELQVKLLRFLENGEIRPVGSDELYHADARIVCATHKPLERLVQEGKFRQDLFYRLASVTISIPSLRERPEDVEMLARKYAQDLKRTLSPKALLRLQAYHWPGNVRELRHTLERASGLAGEFHRELTENDFEFLLTPQNVLESPSLEIGAVLTLHEMERVMLLKALKISRGNRNVAAKILGVARSTLFDMLKRHRIQGPRSVSHQTLASVVPISQSTA